MTANEIRKVSIAAEMNALAKDAIEHGKQITSATAAAIVQVKFLKEIALQLAEFNERCSQNCTGPVSPEGFHHERD